jgi:hypothetical protein
MSNESVNLVVFLSVLWFIIPPIIGSRIAYNRGRSRGGAFALCLVFGWLGLLIVGCWRKDWEELRLREPSHGMADLMYSEEKYIEPEPLRKAPVAPIHGWRRRS